MSPQDIEEAANAFVLEANEEMCCYCFDILLREIFTNNELPEGKPLELPSDLPALAKSPLFITWETKSANTTSINYGLRGCIGVLSPQPLKTAIREYTLLAAFQDRRFNPIVANEVKDLRVAVSLLVKYEPCQDVYDWQVGVHGILIKFTNGPREDYSATFLPEVAKEQRWTPQETVNNLIRKSGYNGPIDDRLLQIIRCTRYQSSKCRVTYQEYVEHIGGVDPLQTAVLNKKRWCFSL